jgi:hypothetical protein
VKKILGMCAAIGFAALFFVFASGASAGCKCDVEVSQHRTVHHYSPPRTNDVIHDRNWMRKQGGISTCSEFRASCYRGANIPGHGLAYPGVCEDRFHECMASGEWHTTHTGSRSGLIRR